jgi:hypothetical protein
MIGVYFITHALSRVFGEQMDTFFSGRYDRPAMPEIGRIRIRETQMLQLGAIFDNEGTIAGTYGVHDRIWLKHLDLKASDGGDANAEDDFRERLWLVHGDQLTTHHNRAVMADQKQATRPYATRRWLLPVPAQFHMSMN